MGVRVVGLRVWWILSLLSVASLAVAATSDLRLLVAVKNQDKEAVRTLLKEHVDVNATQGDGATALQWAVERNDLETAELLLHSGANVNAANDYGVTALSLACANRNDSLVEKLLKVGAKPNLAQVTGETPLMTCARTGSLEGVKSLLAGGANANAKESERGQTALMWAAAQKHPDVTQALVDHGADVHAKSATLPLFTPTFPVTYSVSAHVPKTKGGFTPLMFAAQSGDADSARILLAAGANVNDSTPEDGTALVVAAVNGQEKVALLLIEKGADPNAKDAYGLTALHWALQEGIKTLYGRPADNDRFWEHPNMPELVKSLLVHGADPNARMAKDFLPYNIHRFARNRGNDLPQVGMTGATPLLLAAAAGDYGMMRVLVEGKADPKMSTVEGLTPLLAAAGVGCERNERGGAGAAGGGGGGEDISEELQQKTLEAVKLAVRLGDDVNAIGPGGRTALHGAALWGETEVIKFLAENGANLEAKDMYGETPLTIALGDPGQLVFRQLPNLDFDYTFRNPRSHKKAADLLVKLGAAPYNGPVADRSGQ